MFWNKIKELTIFSAMFLYPLDQKQFSIPPLLFVPRSYNKRFSVKSLCKVGKHKSTAVNNKFIYLYIYINIALHIYINITIHICI